MTAAISVFIHENLLWIISVKAWVAWRDVDMLDVTGTQTCCRPSIGTVHINATKLNRSASVPSEEEHVDVQCVSAMGTYLNNVRHGLMWINFLDLKAMSRPEFLGIWVYRFI